MRFNDITDLGDRTVVDRFSWVRINCHVLKDWKKFKFHE
jgi:hypothetical protein